MAIIVQAATSSVGSNPRTNLATDFATFAAQLTAGDTYREPTGSEPTNAVAGILQLTQGRDASALLTPR